MKNLLNKEYDIVKTLANKSTKVMFTVGAYGVLRGSTIQTVRVVNGVKTAKAENFSIKEFETGIRLSSVVEVG